MQNRYNIIVRDSEPLVDRCEQLGIGFIPWFPIAQGILAQPGNAFTDTAAELGVTTAQLSLAWLLHRSPVVMPIPGTSSIAHLEENLAAGTIGLTDERFITITDLGLRLAPTIDVPAGA